jgi:hypothetical protein
MILAAGRLYATCRSGATVVFKADPKQFAPLALNALGEPTNATPAFSDGQIFIRTARAVWCIGDRK